MKMKEMKNYHSDGRMIYIPGCQHHIVFSPKYRRNVLIGDIEKRLKELITEKQEQYEYKILDMEIMPDHTHLLLDIYPKLRKELIIEKRERRLYGLILGLYCLLVQ
jgi:putative transposase